MRVCLLNRDLFEYTGAGRFALELIRRLQAGNAGIVPVVLTVQRSGNPYERVLLRPRAGWTVFSFSVIRSLFKTCDIIHALDGFPYGVIAAFASFGLGKRLVITAIGTGAVQAFRHPLKRVLLRWAYRQADRVVAISHYTRREILKECPGLDITVINHAVDADEFSGSSDDELSDEEKEEIAKLKPYMLSVGGGKRRKGYEYSFPAFQAVEKRMPGLRYVVVGHDLENTPAPSLGVAEKVRCFLNIRRPFLRALYRNAELFMLLPYDDRGDVEGFGFAFLEAAAAGLPVVGTRESGAEDAVLDGRNGFLVPPRDADAAADAALRILSDPALKERFSKESIAFAVRMNWNAVVEEYAALYRRLTTND